MSLDLRWTGLTETDLIAQTRLRCYGRANTQIENYKKRVDGAHKVNDGDVLLAERDGEAVGTATSLQLAMWVRGGRVPVQGVSWVGTVRTARRRGGGDERGIASRVMDAMLERARERGEVASALMPFRGSYYEHFGYGFVERRCEYTIPTSILPHGDFASLREYAAADLPALAAERQRQVEQGQCEIESGTAGVALHLEAATDGFMLVDEIEGEIHGHISCFVEGEYGNMALRVFNTFTSPAALQRQLHLLASLKDQYGKIILTMPYDMPLHWLLRERQLPHRGVEHAVASARHYTRMQVRVLDHKKFLEAMTLPSDASGRVVVAIAESEKTTTTLAIDIDAGRVSVKPSTQTPAFSCSDVVWAAVCTGDLPATQALSLGLAKGDSASAKVLDAFAWGPLPFTWDYF